MEDSTRDRVRFNVGGKRFETTKSTLDKALPGSYFSCLLAERWNSNDTTVWKTDEIFIDRDPDYFGSLLYLLRTGDLKLNKSICMDLLYKEACFYGLEDQVRAAVRGDLDGERLRLERTVTVPCSIPEPAMIRASPTGGLCIAGVNTLCSYDEWKMEDDHQNPVIRTDSPIYDVLWRDSWDIIVSTKKRIGIFNAASSKLRHWFSENSDFYSSKLCVNSNSNEIYSSCTVESTGMVSGIALWDVETGQLKRILTKAKGGIAKKLHWISEINCVLAICCCRDRLVLKYFDVRLGKKKNEYVCCLTTRPTVVDAVADESKNTTCLIERIGKGSNIFFYDNRKLYTKPDTPYTPYLVQTETDHTCEILSVYCHGGQLFARTKSKVLLLSSNRWVSTKAEAGNSDSIKDISIAGDRLFSLHSNTKVVRVWESPPPLF